MQKVKIYSDGAARGNPNGPGGYGTIVKYFSSTDSPLRVEEFTEGFEITTNNRMELMGVITGLESLNSKSEVIVYSDSKYVVNAFNEGWIDNWLQNGWKTASNKPVKNVDLWGRLLSIKEIHSVTFEWVKGHVGHPENERCDYLATSSADGKKFTKTDEGILVENCDDGES